VRILIADNNDLDIIGLKAICAGIGETRIHVLNKASELSTIDERPDIVLLDFTAEGFGLESIDRFLQRWRGVNIVAITAIQSSVTIMAAIRAGIRGYVKKDCSLEEIEHSIKVCAQSTAFYCGEILRVLDVESIEMLDISEHELDCDAMLLTNRENEILRYIAGGYTNSEIADILFLSSHTVNTHRKNILTKTGATNAAGAVIFAVKHGLIEPDRFEFVRSRMSPAN